MKIEFYISRVYQSADEKQGIWFAFTKRTGSIGNHAHTGNAKTGIRLIRLYGREIVNYFDTTWRELIICNHKFCIVTSKYTQTKEYEVKQW